jgi:hypothetical protein
MSIYSVLDSMLRQRDVYGDRFDGPEDTESYSWVTEVSKMLVYSLDELENHFFKTKFIKMHPHLTLSKRAFTKYKSFAIAIKRLHVDEFWIQMVNPNRKHVQKTFEGIIYSKGTVESRALGVACFAVAGKYFPSESTSEILNWLDANKTNAHDIMYWTLYLKGTPLSSATSIHFDHDHYIHVSNLLSLRTPKQLT